MLCQRRSRIYVQLSGLLCDIDFVTFPNRLINRPQQHAFRLGLSDWSRSSPRQLIGLGLYLTKQVGEIWWKH